MSDQVKRARSPNYPAISLPVALQQLRSLFDRIQKHKAPKEAVLKGLGYGGWNGSSATALSAHTKYGILERLEKDEFKIAELGMRLLFHKSPKEYAEALYEAATKPPLFAELLVEYQNTVPHEDIMRPRLIRQGFAQSAVATVIESYRDTMKFVSDNAMGYTPPPDALSETTMQPHSQPVRSHQETVMGIATGVDGTFSRVSGREPFRVSFAGKSIEIAGKISSQEDADELISAVSALKILLRSVRHSQRHDSDAENIEDDLI